MSYLSERTAAFNAMRSLDMYGSTMLHKGVDYTVIASATDAGKTMQPVNYIAERAVTFDMLRTEFDTSGIGLRSVVAAEGVQFEVYKTMLDPKEPFARLICNRKQ